MTRQLRQTDFSGFINIYILMFYKIIFLSCKKPNITRQFFNFINTYILRVYRIGKFVLSYCLRHKIYLRVYIASSYSYETKKAEKTHPYIYK